MPDFIIIIVLFFLFLSIAIYWQFGINFRIFARKQDQSRRNQLVTGAGIIFALSWVVYFVLNDFISPVFTGVLVVGAVIGLIDDIWEVPLILQLAAHLVLFTVLFSDMNLLSLLSIEKLIFTLIASLLVLLIISKHDGANGLMAASSLTFFATISFLAPAYRTLNVSNPIIYILLGLLAFGWFNFRPKALVFMGASGRIALGYLMVFFMLDLFQKDGNLASLSDLRYLLLFALVSVDYLQAVVRSWLSPNYSNTLPTGYAFLKEKQLPFYVAPLTYAILQALINYLVIAGN